MLHSLLASLSNQGEFTNVEIGYKMDNKEMTTGAKRQWLLENAKGEYIVFIDDDDEVPDYYISEILQALETKPDCLGISGYMTTDGRDRINWTLSKDNPNDTITVGNDLAYRRTTNHITVVKRELALKAGFPDISKGEDAAYSNALNPYLKTEVIIDKPMYHYKFSSFNKQYE